MSGQKKTPSGDVPDLVPNKKRSERAEVPYGGSPEPSCFMTSSMTRRVGRSVPKVGAERGRPADSVMTSSTAEDWAEYRRRSISAGSRLMTSSVTRQVGRSVRKRGGALFHHLFFFFFFSKKISYTYLIMNQRIITDIHTDTKTHTHTHTHTHIHTHTLTNTH